MSWYLNSFWLTRVCKSLWNIFESQNSNCSSDILNKGCKIKPNKIIWNIPRKTSENWFVPLKCTWLAVNFVNSCNVVYSAVHMRSFEHSLPDALSKCMFLSLLTLAQSMERAISHAITRFPSAFFFFERALAD